LALDGVQLISVVHRDAGREVGGAGVLVRLVGDHHDLLRPFGLQFAGDRRHAEAAVYRLAAGHRHRVVVEDLVGDVDAGRDGLAHREQARVVVGAVAEVGEHVLVRRERRLADPGHALAAHLREGHGAAVHPDRHVVAADAGHRARTLGHLGAGVVRAAAAEPGRALAGGIAGGGQRTLLRVDQRQPGLDARARVAVDAELEQPLADRTRDERRREVGLRAQQPVAARVGLAPFAAVAAEGLAALDVDLALVELAQHVGPHVGPPVVELLLELVLDDLALLLDDQDLLQAAREAARDARLQRPHHADLVQADADAPAGGVVQAQVVQRLARVVVALARGDEPQPRRRVAREGVDHRAVEPVGPHVGQRGIPLVIHQPRFLRERRVRPADVQAARRHRKVLGQHDAHALRVELDRGRGLDDLLDRFHRRPHAGEAAHRQGVQAEVEDLLHAGRKEHRKAAGLEDVVALVRGGRALGDVVVAGQGDDAAVLGGAGHVGVLEHVGAAVDAGALAVPDAEDAVVLLRVGVEVELLRAPHGRGRQLLVDARLEDDVLRRQVGLRRPQRLVVAAERRAAVAADEAGGVQAEHGIALLLQHRQSDERLRAAHEGAAGLQAVLVVERNAFQRLSDRLGKGGVHGVTPVGSFEVRRAGS
jgi:hypothetical protein